MFLGKPSKNKSRYRLGSHKCKFEPYGVWYDKQRKVSYKEYIEIINNPCANSSIEGLRKNCTTLVEQDNSREKNSIHCE